MPILIVNHSEELRGLVLQDRVLIGRRPFNTIMLADPAVSRLHAWIGQRDGQWTLFDAGSRIGTVVNTQVLEEPHLLVDGDEIRIGQTLIHYYESDELPGDVTTLDPPPPPPAADPYDGGIYFDCACGGPMWVAASLAGQTGRCRYCGQRLVVPHTSGSKGRPLAPPTIEKRPRPAPARVKQATLARATTAAAPSPAVPDAAARAAFSAPVSAPQTGTCSICQTPIRTDEAQTACPSCHLTFHQQCWEENLGCGAYGCDQVNILAPPAQTALGVPEPNAAPSLEALTYEAAPIAQSSSFPWEPVLLALSFVAMGIGALAFGLPSVIMQFWALAYLLIRKPKRKGMVIAALFVGLIGFLAGFATSMFWWKQIRVWEWFHK
jgi:hypothetical protein